MKTALYVCGLLLAGLAAGAVVLLGGWYDVSATNQHLQPTYMLLETGLRQAVKRRGASIAVPALDDPALVQRGAGYFREYCVACHGAPGVAPEPFALGLVPHPAPLSGTGREWQPGEIFWVIKHGLKMTGMPAWQFRITDEEIWATVAFIRRLPALSPAEYRALKTSKRTTRDLAPIDDGTASAARATTALQQYACVTCHRIPGVVGPEAHFGPPLDGIGGRQLIAGRLPNTRQNMIRWLRDPHRIDPDSAMPPLGVSERDARDMAAYLDTLR